MTPIPKGSRKITGEKFTITIPKLWRESNELEPGDYLLPFWEDGSPLVLIPKTRELDPIEAKLIDLITKYSVRKETHGLGTELAELGAAIAA